MKHLMIFALFFVSVSAFAGECFMRVEIATQRTNGTFFQNQSHPDFSPWTSNTQTWEACYRRSLQFAKANMIGGTERIQLASMGFGRTSTYGQPYVYWAFKTGFFSSIKGALTEYSNDKPKQGDKRVSEHGDPLLGKVQFFMSI